MTASALRSARNIDPLDTTPAAEGRVERSPRTRRPYPSNRLVEMLGSEWLQEKTDWERALIRNKSLGKLALKVGLELSLSVDREPKSKNRGYAVRTHAWFIKEFGGSRSNVQEAISQLRRTGFIRYVSSKQEGVANRYQLWFPAVLFWTDDDDLPPF